ncbi:MAG TPA: glycoside hydrolase family 2 protein [Bacteroidota bacterium]|nr:glycoside hydrolase family 2 protein [Bacteroidota bacterium]
MKELLLDGKWEFKALDIYGMLPARARAASKWMPAEVPGTIHTDLMKLRVIDDPFYRMNENDVQWIDAVKWVYRKRFIVTENLLTEDRVELEAGGLDTYAQIYCNGMKVGMTANMFVEHRFEIKEFLKAGMNELAIIFDSPTRLSKDLQAAHTPLRVANDPHRVFVRKAQYSFGWDWGPRLTTSGIWRSIKLQAYSHGRLSHPFAKTVSVSADEAVVELTVDIERTSDVPLSVHAFIGGGMVAHEYMGTINEGRAMFDVRIPEPRLWWPNEYGAQPMYAAVIELRRGAEEIGVIETSFAVRMVKLLQEKDEEGSSFIIEVNGRKIFCKGADWIPSDSFIPRIPETTYERLLTLAREAHMNMLRVWGGGIYEQDVFYDLCDRLGLMVWQDFMFACGEYPDDAWFHVQVQDEAEKVIRRLRNHPSIVVWCGNNESEWLFCTEHPGASPDDMHGAGIFSSLLPSVCEKLDGTRIYWRSSPFGDGFPNSESNGTHHQWTVWSSWKDYPEYAMDHARFVSEFGFQAPASRSTFDTVTLPKDRFMQSEVMEHHNKQIEGTERLVRFMAAHYRMTDAFDDFIYHGQLVQAEALKFAVEHWRRRKYLTAGTLFWQLNDCWPVSSWSVIDSSLVPKAAYYYAKRFYAPVLISLKPAADTIEVWLTSDWDHPEKGTMVIELLSVNGGVRWKRSKQIVCPPDASFAAARVVKSAVTKYDRSEHYLRVRFETSVGTITENRYFFKEPKHLQLPKPRLSWKLQELKRGQFQLMVSASRLAKNVRIEIEDEHPKLSNNYFDVDGGHTVRVTIDVDRPKGWVKKHLVLRYMQ